MKPEYLRGRSQDVIVRPRSPLSHFGYSWCGCAAELQGDPEVPADLLPPKSSCCCKSIPSFFTLRPKVNGRSFRRMEELQGFEYLLLVEEGIN